MQKLDHYESTLGNKSRETFVKKINRYLVNIIGHKKRITLSRVKRKILRHVWLVRFLILGSVVLTAYLLLVSAGLVLRNTGASRYLGLVYDFITLPSGKIKVIGNRTNILILGKGGAGHDAPDLTDTIIFASFDQDSSSISLISLPRDIWLPDLRAKLNSVYYWGNQRQVGGGLVLAKSVVEEIVGQPVQYAVIFDFEAFKKVIDTLSGIEVEVENSFADKKYPIAGRENDLCGGDSEYKCRYETLRFTQGKRFMDGETALKFVRSRNAEGDEGTDLAREKRQQKVVAAIKDKVLSREILLRPKKWFELRDVALRYVETDLDNSALAILARRFYQSRDNINSQVFPEDLLENPQKSPKYDNLYVFIAKGGSWSEVQKWIESNLK
ncbi:hypothetical protein A2892_04300 [Candidatus Woesebacteria bacterium RIFCSPLOWO2_01_FULL_39_10b]|uniref:Cell envelope-related transcriptional attenuator domain-containing protein n=1 Tax=Candidatus Woesebacteria bacterium RIFCSPLOWO2_01_FULL_39_10b TaxID=1802517 RepID=A0A1F8BBX8_9BACT|nr:MAG: hypothetical protein A2892_04300 [Candidatus Woesebacteria bacterium RIFCSPLOWO2_01_FULL_39_10b]